MSARPKTLLVLNDQTFATALAKFIATRGFEPMLVKTSASALESWKDLKPDVVVATQLLSGTDGPGLCRKIKEERPGLPFVLISAVNSTAGINDVKRTSGAEQVLPAMFQPEMLVVALRKVTTPIPMGGIEKTPSSGSRAAKPVTPTSAVEEQMRKAAEAPPPRVAPPPQPVPPPSPPQIATSAVPAVPMDPAWILSRAFADGVTGALRFVTQGVERIVYFAQGRPIVVTSNVPEERIGQILIRKGRLTQAELDRGLSMVAKRGKRLAEIIVEMGVMTQREHDEELAEQYAERTLALFSWRHASIEFQPRPAPDELIAIRLPPERLVVEGLRRHYDAARLEAAIQDPNRVLLPMPDAGTRLPFLQLTPTEAAGLVLIDGTKSVAQVAMMSPARIDALRAIYACICLGLVI
jgi:CheY-like chemotaxis protein